MTLARHQILWDRLLLYHKDWHDGQVSELVALVMIFRIADNRATTRTWIAATKSMSYGID